MRVVAPWGEGEEQALSFGWGSKLGHCRSLLLDRIDPPRTNNPRQRGRNPLRMGRSWYFIVNHERLVHRLVLRYYISMIT